MRIVLLILCLAAIFCACGERNDGMLTIASEDVPFIYALGVRDSQAYLIVANGESYYREHMITGYTTPTVSVVISVGRSGRAHVGDTNTIYNSSSDYSSWSSQAFVNSILDLSSTPFGNYCLQDNSGDLLYRYDEGSNSWTSMGKSITNAPEKLCYSSTYYKLYVSDNSGGNTSINELGTPVMLTPVAMYPIAIDRIFLAEASGALYVGNNAIGLYRDGALIGSGSGLQSYAVVSPADIFGGTDNTAPPVMLYRLVNLVFTPELYFSMTGVMRLWPMPPDRVIIGIHASTDSDGLYVYNFRKFNLKRINSIPVWAVYAR